MYHGFVFQKYLPHKSFNTLGFAVSDDLVHQDGAQTQLLLVASDDDGEFTFDTISIADDSDHADGFLIPVAVFRTHDKCHFPVVINLGKPGHLCMTDIIHAAEKP